MTSGSNHHFLFVPAQHTSQANEDPKHVFSFALGKKSLQLYNHLKLTEKQETEVFLKHDRGAA